MPAPTTLTTRTAASAAKVHLPHHFARDTYNHAERLLRDASLNLSNTDDAEKAYRKALGELRSQIPPGIQDEKLTPARLFIAGRLPSNPSHRSEPFPALESLVKEYVQFREIAAYDPNTPAPISTYIQKAGSSVQTLLQRIERFIKNEREDFFKAYGENYLTPLAHRQTRDELWKKYEATLRKHLVAPLEAYAEVINGGPLWQQACIHYINRLQQERGETPFAEQQHGPAEIEVLKKPARLMDSNALPIDIKYNTDGSINKIKVSALSPRWFSSLRGIETSGSMGDALLMFYADRGPNIPMEIVFPLSKSDILQSNMDPGMTLAILLLLHRLIQMLEKQHYTGHLAKEALNKGISLDHISIVDTQGKPIVLPKDLLKEIKAKQIEYEKRLSETTAEAQLAATRSISPEEGERRDPRPTPSQGRTPSAS